MIKNELRNKYKALRKALSPTAVDDMSLAIANNLLKLPIWDFEFYHVFLPIEENKEVNTEFILNILSGKDKNIVVSKSDFSTFQMTHYLLTDNTRLKKNDINIPEPIDGIEIPDHKINVVFIPLLAYDTRGNRIGYGKGFYDRFLSACNKDVLKIGLSFFDAEEVVFMVNPNDIPMDYCVTPSKISEF